MGEHITTFTKKQFLPLCPEKKDVCIEDIAHALSLMTRANGHFPKFYSVAQHSLDCAREAKVRGLSNECILYALLHDASEAYLSDITRPVKKYMPQYQEIEENMQKVIFEALIGKTPDVTDWKLIKDIDDAMLYYEFYHFMGEKLFDEPKNALHIPDFTTIPFEEAEQAFLDCYREHRKV